MRGYAELKLRVRRAEKKSEFCRSVFVGHHADENLHPLLHKS